jgi:hypothetical protein
MENKKNPAEFLGAKIISKNQQCKFKGGLMHHGQQQVVQQQQQQTCPCPCCDCGYFDKIN